MAEEEERILVAKLCGRNCPVETNDNICLLGCSCESCNGGLSRQEAIEKMAKAICSKWGISSCKSCAFKGDGSMCQDFIDEKKSLAEAALNALLERK